jgi:hypothetical protein
MSPGPERGAKELLDPSQEHLAIHRSVGDHRCGQLMAAQTGYKGGGLPIAERGRSDASPAFGGAPVAPCRPCRAEAHHPFGINAIACVIAC